MTNVPVLEKKESNFAPPPPPRPQKKKKKRRVIGERGLEKGGLRERCERVGKKLKERE